MLKQNIFFVASKKIVFETAGDFVYFPVWWYTVGLKQIIENRISSVTGMASNLALRILVQSLFKPMFGQYDRAGRIISFFMRIVIMIARLIYFGIYTILQFVIIIVWIAVPAYIVYRIISMYTFSYVGG